MVANANSTREEKGKQIAITQNCVSRVDDTKYKVKSQSGKGFYDVKETDYGMTCTCKDFVNRGGKCKHILATKYYLEVQQETPQGIVTEKIHLTLNHLNYFFEPISKPFSRSCIH